jgi:DNA polymerase alpha-associated DNA helicase A
MVPASNGCSTYSIGPFTFLSSVKLSMILMRLFTHRMHSQICAFPSKTLYSSKLKSHPSVAGRLLQDLSNAHADSEDAKEMLVTPVVFFDTAGCEYFERMDGDADEGSRCNENEATVVKNWVDRLARIAVCS